MTDGMNLQKNINNLRLKTQGSDVFGKACASHCGKITFPEHAGISNGKTKDITITDRSEEVY